MTETQTENEDGAPPRTAPPVMPRPAPVRRRRNQLVGIVLAVVAVLVFATVVALVILFHYSETHHGLPKL